MEFAISRATRIAAQWNSLPVQRGITRFQRDMELTLAPVDCTPGNEIVICLNPNLPPESYTLDLQTANTLIVCAADDLGAVYALLYLSREYLGVLPFWYWNEQAFEQKPLATISLTHYTARPTGVGLRGWALDAEPLLDAWCNGDNAGWEMVFEALLRCGGNMVRVRPGAVAELAAAMGLWLLQPDAQPLNAAPFPEVYPHLAPDWRTQEQAYRALWGEAIRRQKVHNTVWHLGFRAADGQSFWAEDPACITMEQRGKRLGEILCVQYNLLRAAAPTAPAYTVLNAEEAALYRSGVLHLPADVILLWDAGGYTLPHATAPRPAPAALPPELVEPPHGEFTAPRGIFYRLAGQGNSLTAWSGDMAAAEQDLRCCLQSGANALWLFSAPNLRPHLYPLDFAAALWRDPALAAAEHRLDYLRDYYRAPDGWALSNTALDDLATCLKAWGDSTARLAATPGLPLGEGFMAYGTRAFATAWLCGKTGSTVPAMRALVGERAFGEQLTLFRSACVAAMARFDTLLAGSDYARRRCTPLWQDTFQLQVRLYQTCLHGAVRFCDACALYFRQDYRECFLMLGNAAADYTAGDALLKNAARARWAGFYDNDPYTDCRGTADLLYTLMGLVRAAGDTPPGSWQRQVEGDTPTPRLRERELFAAMQAQKQQGDQ